MILLEKTGAKSDTDRFKGDFIRFFAKDDLILIEDISDFVKEQYQFVLNDDLDNLIIPAEKPLLFEDENLNKKLKIQ
jgi:hypothetical protein